MSAADSWIQETRENTNCGHGGSDRHDTCTVRRRYPHVVPGCGGGEGEMLVLEIAPLFHYRTVYVALSPPMNDFAFYCACLLLYSTVQCTEYGVRISGYVAPDQ